MSNEQSTMVKTIALTAATLALLSACGEATATPMDDEYSGNSGESVQSQQEKSQTSGSATGDSSDSSDSTDSGDSSTSSKEDTGNYADGDYSINSTYGPVGEDSIDVYLTIKDQNITAVKVVGHALTSLSEDHQNDFSEAVQGVVVGKPLKDLKIDKLAGASWTSDAFNKALDVARQEASIQ